MHSFKFSKEKKQVAKPVFEGTLFYETYKYADFLKKNENIEMILSQTYDLRQSMKELKPGECIQVQDMFVNPNSSLVIKKTGPNITVNPYEFTLNRLTGLVATHVFLKRNSFPNLVSCEARALGLEWDNTNKCKCLIYLSAVTGTEHFTEIFGVIPLLCAIFKFKMQKLPFQLVLKAGKIRNRRGEPMASVLKQMKNVQRFWKMFPNGDRDTFKNVLATFPVEMKQLFND